MDEEVLFNGAEQPQEQTAYTEDNIRHLNDKSKVVSQQLYIEASF